MDDSDDYFDDDDLVLDEATLAILDKEEHKHTLPQSTPDSQSRPAKRQKTGHGGWGGFVGRSTVEDDFEDMPEISVRDDGSYGMRGSQGLDVLVRANNTVDLPQSATLSTSKPNPPSRVPTRTESVLRPPPTRRASTPSSIFQRNRSIREALKDSPHVPAAGTNNRVEPTFRASQAPQLLPSQALQLPPSQSQRRNSPAPPASLGTNERRLQRELEILNARMEELQRKAEEAEKAAKAAEDARFAKEGEVSILRKTMEKTAREHAANITRLKSAKEAAEAAQAQLQKEMKEEMERLRTEFLFKQHEIETSLRRPPGSVRSTRINRDVPMTPAHMTTPRVPRSALRNPGILGSSPLVRKNVVPPPQFGEFEQGPSKLPRVRRDTPKKPAPLPGFYNSFLPGPAPREPTPKTIRPKPSSQACDKKGKGRHVPSPSLFSYHSQVLSNEPIPSPPSSPTTRGHAGESDDVVMDDTDAKGSDPSEAPMEAELEVQEEIDDAAMEGIEILEPPDYPTELRRLVFSHALHSQPLTLQMLLGAPISSTVSSHDRDHYLSACGSLLELLGATPGVSWESLAQRVSEVLLKLVQPLSFSDLTSHLAALLNMLSVLSFAFSTIATAALSPSEATYNANQPPPIVAVLYDIIHRHVVPTKCAGDEGHRDLVREIVGLIEALCFSADDACDEYLSEVLAADGVLRVLVDSAQPSWLLDRATRCLALLASRETVARSLISKPVQGASDEDQAGNQGQLGAHIELLAALLADQARVDPEMESTRANILTFFAMLSVSGAAAVTLLLESPTVLPSLIVLMARLAGLLWDQVDTTDSVLSPRERIRTIYQALTLLQYLVCGQGVDFYDLRRSLHNAPHRQFNGLIHIFIVTFGRLSYADAPQWMSAELCNEVDDMRDMARALLELVVEGPELDSIYAAYQEDDSEVDGEEMEARNLETNSLE